MKSCAQQFRCTGKFIRPHHFIFLKYKLPRAIATVENLRCWNILQTVLTAQRGSLHCTGLLLQTRMKPPAFFTILHSLIQAHVTRTKDPAHLPGGYVDEFDSVSADVLDSRYRVFLHNLHEFEREKTSSACFACSEASLAMGLGPVIVGHFRPSFPCKRGPKRGRLAVARAPFRVASSGMTSAMQERCASGCGTGGVSRLSPPLSRSLARALRALFTVDERHRAPRSRCGRVA
ncbi:hypothetical protein AcV7_003274 [Taiwanofungus camphoratus]|nr:hypothetical protein AcV7_003274 [Antrodia cinnamomea]